MLSTLAQLWPRLHHHLDNHIERVSRTAEVFPFGLSSRVVLPISPMIPFSLRLRLIAQLFALSRGVLDGPLMRPDCCATRLLSSSSSVQPARLQGDDTSRESLVRSYVAIFLVFQISVVRRLLAQVFRAEGARLGAVQASCSLAALLAAATLAGRNNKVVSWKRGLDCRIK